MAIVRRHVPGGVVYLFGSRARDTQQSGSDIDIAIDAGAPIAREKILAILLAVDETIIPLKVDVIDLATASDDLKKNILREGVRWSD